MERAKVIGNAGAIGGRGVSTQPQEQSDWFRRTIERREAARNSQSASLVQTSAQKDQLASAGNCKPDDYNDLIQYLIVEFRKKEDELIVGNHNSNIPFSYNKSCKKTLFIDVGHLIVRYMAWKPEGDTQHWHQIFESLITLAQIARCLEQLEFNSLRELLKDFRVILMGLGNPLLSARYPEGTKSFTVGDTIFDYLRILILLARNCLDENPEDLNGIDDDDLQWVGVDVSSDLDSLLIDLSNKLNATPPKRSNRSAVSMTTTSPSTPGLADQSTIDLATPDEDFYVAIDGSMSEVLSTIFERYETLARNPEFFSIQEGIRIVKWALVNQPDYEVEWDIIQKKMDNVLENGVLNDRELVEAILDKNRNIKSRWGDEYSKENLESWYLLKTKGRGALDLKRANGRASVIRQLVIDRCVMVGLLPMV